MAAQIREFGRRQQVPRRHDALRICPDFAREGDEKLLVGDEIVHEPGEEPRRPRRRPQGLGRQPRDLEEARQPLRRAAEEGEGRNRHRLRPRLVHGGGAPAGSEAGFAIHQ